MSVYDIAIRLLMITVFAGVIGYEREINNANAGLKTHMIVGVAAAIIALIQQQINIDSFQQALLHPELVSLFRADPARLTAQIVSGIGFLGAGTIIVTKRTISGLTTAASIWSIAALGIAIGMGYYEIAGVGFLFLFLILFITRRIQAHSFTERLHIRYIGGQETLETIEKTFEAMNVKAKHVKYDSDMYGHERLYTSVFELPRNFEFENFVSTLSKMQTIISVQTTNIE